MKNPIKQWSSKKKIKKLAQEFGILTKKDTFDFGKYKGLAVKDVLKKDPGYICWVHDNTKVRFLSSIIKDARERASKLSLERAATRPAYYSGSRGGYRFGEDDYYDEYMEFVDCGGFW